MIGDAALPVVFVQRDRDGFASFRCPWCGSIHHHGKGDGSRASHCRDPKAPSSYYIKTAGAP